jgi:hypothetical protein
MFFDHYRVVSKLRNKRSGHQWVSLNWIEQEIKKSSLCSHPRGTRTRKVSEKYVINNNNAGELQILLYYVLS